ncbi:holo-ACP synthase [Furfurilactobacillus sp. WILCCON 0119]
MISGVGIDLTEISRVAALAKQHDSFIKKVLTPAEREVLATFSGTRFDEFLAGRFSVKEAYSKAFGTGIGKNVGFQDIEVLDNAVGQPHVVRHPFAGQAHVSISHTDSLVMTEVILETTAE